MSGPRNNLEDILKKRQQSTATTPAGLATSQSQSQSQDGAPKSKFRVASRPSPPNTAAQKPAAPLQKSPSYTSFSTPGFGKKQTAPFNHSVNSSIASTSVKNTSASIYERRNEVAAAPSTPAAQAITSLPAKRTSPFVDPHPKRSRPDASKTSDKENYDTQPADIDIDSEPTLSDESDVSIVMISHRDKGKGREVAQSLPPPPSSQRNIDFHQLSTPSKPSGRGASSLSSAPSSRRVPASSITTTAAGVTTTRASALNVQSSSVPRAEHAPGGADNDSQRHLILDYSDMVTIASEDLVEMKNKAIDVRSHLVDVRADECGKPTLLMIRQIEDVMQDRIRCIDAILTARKTGQSVVLPAPSWTTSSASKPPSLPPHPVLLSSDAHGPVARDAPVFDPHGDIPSFDNYEPDHDTLDPSFDDLMQDSAPQQSNGGNNYPEPSVHAPASDDELWNQFDDPMLSPDPVISSLPPPPPPPPPAQAVAGPSRREPAVPDDETVQRPNPGLTKTPFYGDLVRTLQNVFGLKSFRKNQLEACTDSMQGRDVFVLMPTGGGKSLCFQLPAVVKNKQMDGVTVVICPLVALMQDQVSALQKRGVKVASFDSTQSAQEANKMHQMLRTPGSRPALLYVTPEKLEKSQRLISDVMALYKEGLLVRFVADEAHCIITWGRDFRGSYNDFTWIRDRYPDVPVIALTATVNKQGIIDIIARLRMRNCSQYTSSFNRPNLYYDIRPRPAKMTALYTEIIAAINQRYRGETGIIYCSSKIKCQELAQELRRAKIKADYFHAEISGSEKQRIVDGWQAGHIKVVVATIAFGMGIDKPDVRFVFHTAIPNSLCDYYQETGRAGRDGKPSDCILYYAWADAAWKMRRAREEALEKGDASLAEHAVEHVTRVVQYCMNAVDCRRKQVLAFFDEPFDPKKCNNMCDNCKNEAPVTTLDITALAINFVKLVQQAQQKNIRAARGTLTKAFYGKMDRATQDRGFEQLAGFGAGAEAAKANRDLPERLHDLLVAQGILMTKAEGNGRSGYAQDYTYAGPKAPAFLRNRPTLTIGFRAKIKASRRNQPKTTSQDDGKGAPASRRTKKIVEIAEDPIDDYDDDDDDEGAYLVDIPDEDYAPEPIAGPSRQPATRKAAANLASAVIDIDDEVELIDNPTSQQVVRDSLQDGCLVALKQCRDKFMLESDYGDIVAKELGDEHLQILSLLLPRDMSSLESEMRDDQVAFDALNSKIPSLFPEILNICLRFRSFLPPDPQSKRKPSSKAALGARSKPPSIAQLHNNYDYPGGASKPASKRK
ncbi:ATP-dependent DNA helicase-like protein [Phanerochaete sordida]|uniref:DNA 3'-5' helicase n=1 Tax=Phanerochaete sordida TaxID=48140 RepID=A0A9P3GMN6_9APHY|nr:ATP-dependent DNA helicase-like protein [Phanerochaete sordida]